MIVYTITKLCAQKAKAYIGTPISLQTRSYSEGFYKSLAGRETGDLTTGWSDKFPFPFGLLKLEKSACSASSYKYTIHI